MKRTTTAKPPGAPRLRSADGRAPRRRTELAARIAAAVTMALLIAGCTASTGNRYRGTSAAHREGC